MHELAVVLSRDAAKTIDTAVEGVFDSCSIRYVGTATDGSDLTTNGTATATNTSVLNAFHVKEIVDYQRTNEYPPFTPNGDYICIGTTKALRGLKDDSSWENAALYGDVERLFRGEVRHPADLVKRDELRGSPSRVIRSQARRETVLKVQRPEAETDMSVMPPRAFRSANADMIWSDLYSDIQNQRIKSLWDNTLGRYYGVRFNNGACYAN